MFPKESYQIAGLPDRGASSRCNGPRGAAAQDLKDSSNVLFCSCQCVSSITGSLARLISSHLVHAISAPARVLAQFSVMLALSLIFLQLLPTGPSFIPWCQRKLVYSLFHMIGLQIFEHNDLGSQVFQNQMSRCSRHVYSSSTQKPAPLLSLIPPVSPHFAFSLQLSSINLLS